MKLFGPYSDCTALAETIVSAFPSVAVWEDPRLFSAAAVQKSGHKDDNHQLSAFLLCN